MPKYLWKASYTTRGVKGVSEGGGTGRRDAVRKATESVGARLKPFTSPSARTTRM
jgi:uncharacterized protein with GYD domain